MLVDVRNRKKFGGVRKRKFVPTIEMPNYDVINGYPMFMAVKSQNSFYTIMVGKITQVIVGNKFDIVKVKIKRHNGTHITIDCYVRETLARKQVYALKTDIYTLIYGDYIRGCKYSLYVWAFWQTFVPLAYDRKNTYKENFNQFDKMESELKENQDFLDLFDKENERKDEND